METDRWGVPPNMFGAVSEDFYGGVGRIALVSALLEDRLRVLFGLLADAVQEQQVGASGTELIKACRRHLGSLPADRVDAVQKLLADAESALLRRHEVIHSLWPFSGSVQVRGWRNVPASRRQDRDQPVEWTSMHSEELPDLVRELVELVARCNQAQTWVRP